MGVTQIEWTATIRPDGTVAPGYSYNPWRGCTKVSAGCKYCYAETLSKRNPGTLGVWGPNGERAPAAESYWRQPLKWNREAQEAGERRRVFCASLADVFEGPETCQKPDAYAVVEAGRRRLWAVIAATPWLDWLLLTKRPENILPLLHEDLNTIRDDPDSWSRAGLTPEGAGAACALLSMWLAIQPPANVWLGTSVEDQAAADERIPHLLRVPAIVRFLSCEPLIGPVVLHPSWLPCAKCRGRGWYLRRFADNIPTPCDECDRYARAAGVSVLPGQYAKPGPRVDWVIVGGESGPGVRPMHPDWARSLRDQCAAARVAFHFKQWGNWEPFVYVSPDGTRLLNLGVSDKDPKIRLIDSGGRAINVRNIGKKAAGRILDGREWNQFPKGAAND